MALTAFLGLTVSFQPQWCQSLSVSLLASWQRRDPTWVSLQPDCNDWKVWNDKDGENAIFRVSLMLVYAKTTRKYFHGYFYSISHITVVRPENTQFLPPPTKKATSYLSVVTGPTGVKGGTHKRPALNVGQ